MTDILDQLAICIEKGKVDITSAYPPEMKGEEGALELTKKALENHTPNEILAKALMAGMHNIGEQFSQGKAFIPNLMIAAKAMNAAMTQLRPYFDSGEAQRKGTVILGTIKGDLHDIGKNIVRMVLEGDGWKVVDLGVNVDAARFLSAIDEHSGTIVGMSALLSSTMLGMAEATKSIKERYPAVKVFVGGAPVSAAFSAKIGADGYFPDPYSFAKYLTEQFAGE